MFEYFPYSQLMSRNISFSVFGNQFLFLSQRTNFFNANFDSIGYSYLTKIKLNVSKLVFGAIK